MTAFLDGVFLARALLAFTGALSFGGETKAVTEAPSSRISAVVSMLGDFVALAASFLILGDVIAAGALGIPSFYVSRFIPSLRKPRHDHPMRLHRVVHLSLKVALVRRKFPR